MQFREWMEIALYDPQKGYYSTHLGSTPDYVTAPNFGPYLGQGVARELMNAWKLMPPSITPEIFTLVEVGCGAQPQLAGAVLETWRSEHPDLFSRVQVILVDRSVPRLAQAVACLEALYPGKVYGCPDVSQIPKVHGAVVSNELLDAFPVRLIRKISGDTVEEAFIEESAKGTPVCVWRLCEDPVVISFGLELAEGVPYAFNPEALHYLETVSSRLEHGLVLTIDYGDVRPLLFARTAVKAFSGGRVDAPDLLRSGTQDITSPVDFSLLMEWGERLKLETIHYESLSKFLLHNGVGNSFQEPTTKDAIESNLRIKTLIHPNGFGEDFKVLLQGK